MAGETSIVPRPGAGREPAAAMRHAA